LPPTIGGKSKLLWKGAPPRSLSSLLIKNSETRKENTQEEEEEEDNMEDEK